MKKSLVTLASMIAIVGSASAADLPSKKSAPIQAPPPMWTGFYAGLNAGYAFDNGSGVSTTGIPGYGTMDYFEYNDGALVLPGVASALSMTNMSALNGGGFIGGGQIGYNYQWNQNVVVGFEADFQGTAQQSKGVSLGSAVASYDAGYSEMTPFNAIMNHTKSLPWLGTARARLGYIVTPSLLLYGTGGFAYGGANASSFASQNAVNWANGEYYGSGFGSSSYSTVLVGWAAGGGAEWMFMPNWSVKLEGIYYNLATASWKTFVFNQGWYNSTTPAYTFATAQHSTNFAGTIARAGVNYHFNLGSAPVVAKF